MQIAMSLITSVSALTLAYEGVPDRSIYVAAGLGMLAMMPYTVICIFPTNHQLESAEKKEDREVLLLNIEACSASLCNYCAGLT